MVKLYINNEFVGIFRALCDTGSQPNLLVHSAVKNHISRAKSINKIVTGISNEPLHIKREIVACVQPWFESHECSQIELSFFVLPKSCKWAPILPEQNISCATMKKDLKPTLADPLFWKSDKISMLLGIETWAAIMNEKSYTISKNLLCQESKLGNLLLGAYNNEANTSSKLLTVNSVHNLDELEKTIQRFWHF